MRILVKTPLNPYSGYGNDGIGIVRALLHAGLDVYVDPTHVSPPLPEDIAQLLTRRLAAPFDLLIHHVDPGQMELSPQARRAAEVTVAWTMWEYSTLQNLKGVRSMRKRLRNYDVVLGYDSVSTEALSPYLTASACGTLQGGFWPEDWPVAQRDWTSDRFSFCMVGQLHQRKDPFIAVEAFRELKEEFPAEFEPAELHCKDAGLHLHPAMEQWIPKLRIHYAVWPQDVLYDFYASQHVLLAPSRGEGKNMPALEFMSTGGTVIATNWGGHTQWLHSAYSYPLNYTLAPVEPSKPDCLNARASKEHLKALMLHTFRNRDEVAHKGAMAARQIPQMCNWDAVIERLFVKLSELAPRTGHHLLDQYRRNNDAARGQVSVDVTRG